MKSLFKFAFNVFKIYKPFSYNMYLLQMFKKQIPLDNAQSCFESNLSKLIWEQTLLIPLFFFRIIKNIGGWKDFTIL